MHAAFETKIFLFCHFVATEFTLKTFRKAHHQNASQFAIAMSLL
jgi:hypothetical protein